MNRNYYLDILRAFAVILVLGRHIDIFPTQSDLVLTIVEFWHRGGWVGVDLFFVLSGFLISGLLFKEYNVWGRIQIGRFLLRRALKIYPPFWALMVFIICLRVIRHQSLEWDKIGAELLFFQNYWPGIWRQTWTLAVEEHFYLLSAVGIFWMTRMYRDRPFRFLPGVLAFVAAACLYLRISNANQHAFEYMTHTFPTHLRMDSLGIGVYLAYLCQYKLRVVERIARHKIFLVGVGTALLSLPFIADLESSPFIYTWGYTLAYIGSACLVLVAANSKNSTRTGVKAIAYIGSHSYSIYLWHMVVEIGASNYFNQLPKNFFWWMAYLTAYICGSLTLGIFCSKCVEMPVIRFRERMFPSRSRFMP
ncbi:acyltransferase family protein [Prosthecobacter sp.]|uniref:acyltransferase family protein n=1 Tax=Prosthecobacter sp. TaxID=1965333 RepID=UPI0037835123